MANQAADTNQALDPKPKKHRVKRIFSTILIVLGCVLAPLSVIGVWMSNTLLDTDQYVETVAPLASQPDVQKAVAERLSLAVAKGVDLDEKVTDALPARAAFLAEPISTAVTGVIEDVTLRFVESDKFETLWTEANRRAHGLVVGILKGEGTENVSTKNGQVVVQLGPVATKIREVLADHGLESVLASGSGSKTEFVLFDSESLSKAQGAVKILDSLSIVLPILTALFLAGGILLASDRRKALVRAALGVALAMGLVLTVFNLGRSAYIDALKDRGGTGVAGAAAWDQVLSFLRLAMRTVFALAIIVVIGAWLAGPGKQATKIRTWVRDALQGSDAERASAPSGAAVFVAEHKSILRAVAVGLGLVLMMVVAAPGPITVLVVALLVLAALCVIEVLGRGVDSPTRVGSAS